MAQLFANNVSTKLDTSIQSTDTSMTVWSSAGMPTFGAVAGDATLAQTYRQAFYESLGIKKAA